MLQVRTHQLVISVPKTLAHHASTLLPLPDGRVLVAWFGGSRESSNDVSIWFSERTQGRFSEPRCIASSMEPHCGNSTQNGHYFLFRLDVCSHNRWTTVLDSGHRFLKKMYVRSYVSGRGFSHRFLPFWDLCSRLFGTISPSSMSYHRGGLSG